MGMWENQLLAVSKFLKLFAATARIHYAKCSTSSSGNAEIAYFSPMVEQ